MSTPLTRDYAITFLYYDDIRAVAPFYEDVLGMELVKDHGLALTYRIGGRCYVGLVDGSRGHLKAQPKSVVLLTIVVEDVEGWHARLTELGAPALGPIQHGFYCDHFFFEDPAGYALEIQRFRDPEVAALY